MYCIVYGHLHSASPGISQTEAVDMLICSNCVYPPLDIRLRYFGFCRQNLMQVLEEFICLCIHNFYRIRLEFTDLLPAQ